MKGNINRVWLWLRVVYKEQLNTVSVIELFSWMKTHLQLVRLKVLCLIHIIHIFIYNIGQRN